MSIVNANNSRAIRIDAIHVRFPLGEHPRCALGKNGLALKRLLIFLFFYNSVIISIMISSTDKLSNPR